MLQSVSQFPDNPREFQTRSSRLGDNIIIRGNEKSFVKPVKLSDHPFNTVSHNGIPRLAAYGNADSSRSTAGFSTDNDEVLRVNFPPMTGKPQEFMPFQQPFILGKTLGRHRAVTWMRR